MHTLKCVDYDFVIETYKDILKLNEEYIKNWSADIHVFYRGQANCSWKIAPSISRNNVLSEFDIIQQAINCKNSDTHKLSLFEYIAYMQHYNYPTRFLDLTTNLDVALYFACADSRNADKDGKLFMFTYGERKPSSQDVMILSELCLLQTEISVENFSKQLINKYTEFEKYSYSTDIQELSMNAISFLDHGFVVLPEENDYINMKLHNLRIKQQSGAFFICGNKSKKPFTSWDRISTHAGHNIILPEVNPVPSTLWHPDWSYSLRIPSSLKSHILYMLAKKGITEHYLFPEEKSDLTY